MRLYYPTSKRPSNGLFSRPRYYARLDYCHGLLHFLINFPKQSWVVRLLATAFSIFTYCTAYLVDTIPASIDAPPCVFGADDTSPNRIPVAVFSHGMAGSRNMHAALCTSLASQGFLVAALEHRDGTASCAALMKDDGKDGGGAGGCFAGGDALGIQYQPFVHHQPHMHTDDVWAWRRKQLATRTAEFNTAIDALLAAADGRGAPRNIFPSSRFDASTLNGAVDVSRLVGIGHSFGGSTVVAATATNKRIRRAVLLDPATKIMGDAAHAASVPTLVINSHKWPEDMQPLYSNATAAWLEAEVAFVLHQDFSDQSDLRLPWTMGFINWAEGRGRKDRVDLHRLYDFKLSLMHLFFDEVRRAEKSGGDDDALVAALHLGATELVGR